MSVQHKNERLDQGKVRLITFIGFLFGLSISILVYLSSSYYKAAIASDNVGFFYMIAFACLLFALLNLHKSVSWFGRARTLLVLLLTQIVVLTFLSILPIGLVGAGLLTGYYILYGVIWAMLDIILEAYSADHASGRIRGVFLSVWGAGAVIGPLISTQIIDTYGFGVLFFFALVLYMLIFVITLVFLNNIRGYIKKIPFSIADVVRDTLRNTELRKVYTLGVTLRFFFAVMTIFTPLYLRALDFSWTEIGWIFTVMLIPFVLFEYPAGILADKKYGEKGLLLLGLSIIVLAVFLIAFTDIEGMGMWMMVLFLSRTGAALFESMQESYFYKQIDGQAVAAMSFFRTTRSIGYISASLFASVTLFFTDLRGVFAVLFCVLLLGFIPALKLKDTRVLRERKVV